MKHNFQHVYILIPDVTLGQRWRLRILVFIEPYHVANKVVLRCVSDKYTTQNNAKPIAKAKQIIIYSSKR